MSTGTDWSIFSHLPDEAQVWVHGFPTALNTETEQGVLRRLEAFATSWVSHGTPVTAAFTICEKRFLVTAGFCPGGLSGCSKDSYFRCLKRIAAETGADALQTGMIFFRDPSGEIRASEHLDFHAIVETGRISPSTPVIDTLIDSLAALRKGGLERPFGESWHARTYQLVGGAG